VETAAAPAVASAQTAVGSRLLAPRSRLLALGSRLLALGSRLSAVGSRLSAVGPGSRVPYRENRSIAENRPRKSLPESETRASLIIGRVQGFELPAPKAKSRRNPRVESRKPTAESRKPSR